MGKHRRFHSCRRGKLRRRCPRGARRNRHGLPREDLLHIKTIRIPTAFVDCYIYHTEIDPDGIILQDGETVDWRWVTIDELEATIADGTFSEPEIEQYTACKDALVEALAALQ